MSAPVGTKDEFPPGACAKSTHADGGHCLHWREGDGDCCACGLSNDLGDDGQCRHIMIEMSAGTGRCEECKAVVDHSSGFAILVVTTTDEKDVLR